MDSVLKNSHFHAGSPPATDIDTELNKAKRLEQENPVEALKIYSRLAEKGNPEAQQRFEVILSTLQGIAHAGAEEFPTSINSRFDRLRKIAGQFDELNRKDDITRNGLSILLQRALVDVIREDKKGSVQERMTITQSDITTALKDLASLNPDWAWMTQEKNWPPLPMLLKEGVEHYNQEKGTAIAVMTQEVVELPEKLWDAIEDTTPLIHLGRTSHAYQEKYDQEKLWKARLREQALTLAGGKTAKEAFLTVPDLRKEKYLPCDQKGIQFLEQEGITDPMWLQRIRAGQLTVGEIAAATGKQSQDASQRERKKTATLLSQEGMKNRLIDKTPSFHQLADATNAESKALRTATIQEFLGREENRPYIDQVNDSWQAEKALKNPWVRERLNDKTLTVQQLVEATGEGVKAFRRSEIQHFLEQQENQPYIGQAIRFSQEAAEALGNAWVRDRLADGTLTFQQLGNITEEGSRALCNPTIQVFLEQQENRPYIGQVSSFFWKAATALRNGWVRDRLTDKTLTFQQLARITKGESRALCTPKIQALLEQKENQPYLSRVSNFSSETVEALESDWVRDRLADGTLTFQQLADITQGESKALCNPKIQALLGQAENQPYLSRVGKFSSEAVEALENDWIRARLADGALSFQQLVEVTVAGSNTLRNPTMQEFLGRKENRGYIGLVSSFSWDAAIALGEVWIRAQLTDGTLSFDELAKVTSEGSEALCKPNVQVFLEQDKNRQYIGQVSRFSLGAAQALGNAWVRERLADGTLTFEELTKVTYEVSKALCDPAIQDFLGRKENREYIGLVSGFSMQAVEALKNGWVRAQIVKTLLKFPSLTDITWQGSNKLCDATVQRDIEREHKWELMEELTKPNFKDNKSKDSKSFG